MNWQELKQASLDDVLAWAESQPWCRAMADCAQDAQWHSEGDVWTHTKMVCQQLAGLSEWPTLTSDERTVLTFTALFHDAAKPLTTEADPETGRITSPKHAVKGEHLTRGVLRDLGCDLATREIISRLVRYHGRPAFLLERSEPIHEVVRLSWLVSNRLLYLFALADTRGRDTDSMTRPEENLHYWKLLAEENACYEQPYPFANDHARFLCFRQREPNLHYVPHEAFACRVTVLSGLPGSGKDTWLSRNRSDLPVVSLDDSRLNPGVDLWTDIIWSKQSKRNHATLPAVTGRIRPQRVKSAVLLPAGLAEDVWQLAPWIVRSLVGNPDVMSPSAYQVKKAVQEIKALAVRFGDEQFQAQVQRMMNAEQQTLARRRVRPSTRLGLRSTPRRASCL